MKEIELIPNPSALIEATRSIGYSIETAIADLIDNSVTANAKRIWIDFDASTSKPYVSILDDGVGMDFETLQNAMKYGSTDPIFQRGANDLGRFGLGLKTASMSQCRKLTVVSKVSNHTHALSWDLDYIRERSKWTVLELDQTLIDSLITNSLLNKLDNGTLVIWENLDRLSEGSSEKVNDILSKKMTDVRNHLSLVFHRFLDVNEKSTPNIAIYMNGNSIEPLDPFMTPYSTKLMDEETFKISFANEIGEIREEAIKLTPFILPFPTSIPPEILEKYTANETLKSSQGFYVYRNNRLIIWGTWFRLLKQHDAYKLARIRVDIPNSIDFLWSLDVKKSTATPPYALRPPLKKMIEYISNFSAKKYKYRAEVEEDPKVLHAWLREDTRNGIDYRINAKHPVLLDLEESLNNDQLAKLKLFLKNVESNIPVNAIFMDYSGDQKLRNHENDNSQELKDLALPFLSDCKNEIDIEVSIALLRKLDLFKDKEELLREIEMEAISCLEQ